MIVPALITLAEHEGNWQAYEDALYAEYLATIVRAGLRFQGAPVSTRRSPEARNKAYGFWHIISEAQSRTNRNKEDRIPDIKRCERIRWVAWCILHAGSPGVSWWENERGRETHVVIWAEEHDFAVILAKRNGSDGQPYYLLKSSYWVRAHNISKFTRERDQFWGAQKTEAPTHRCARASDTPSTHGR